MGYATLNKIILLFPQAFWPQNVDFCASHPESTLFMPVIMVGAFLPDGSITSDELRVFMSLNDHHPGLLCVFVHGKHAIAWEDRSDEENVDRCGSLYYP